MSGRHPRKVFLVGEGPHDIGDLATEPAFRPARPQPGFVQPVLGRLAGRPLEIDGQRVSSFRARRARSSAEAMANKARVAALLAGDRGSDALVFVTDVDRGEGRRTPLQARRLVTQLHAAVSRGVAIARVDVAVVIGTPCRTIEAWALGDAEAVCAVARRRAPVRLPAAPESLWGDPRDPAPDHPKRVLQRQFRTPPGRAQYAAIAQRADLEMLRRSCPLSFAPFASAVSATLG